MTVYTPLIESGRARIAFDPKACEADVTLARQFARRPNAGLVVGGDPAQAIASFRPDCHSITYGTSGTGKTTCVAIPTLCATAASREQPHLIVVDVKQTLWDETSGWVAAQGYRVDRIDLRGTASSHAYNPLDPAARAYRRGDEARAEELVDMVAQSIGTATENSKDVYWKNAAIRLFCTIFVGLADTQSGNISIPDIVTMAYAEIAEQKCFVNRARKSVADRLTNVFRLHFDGIERTWGCILDVMSNMCAFFVSPIGRAVAAASTFDPLDNLLDGRPSALYLTVPDDTDAANIYVSLLIDSIYRQYVHEFEARHLERRRTRPVMCVIDEAARLPRCGLTHIMAAGRSRRFFVHLFMQSFSQFLEHGLYSEAEARVIVEQAKVAVYLSTTSKEIGEDACARSGGLISAQDLASLSRGEALVARTGYPLLRTRLSPIERYRELGMFERIPPPNSKKRPDNRRERDSDAH